MAWTQTEARRVSGRGSSLLSLVLAVMVLAVIVLVVMFGFGGARSDEGPRGTIPIGLLLKDKVALIGVKTGLGGYIRRTGKLPPKLSDAGIKRSQVLDHTGKPYTYVSGVDTTDPPWYIIMYGAALDCHRVVLTVTLEDKTMNEEDFRKQIDAQEEERELEFIPADR